MTKETLDSWYVDRFPGKKQEQKEEFICSMCFDTGEVSCNQMDEDGNIEIGTGTRTCPHVLEEGSYEVED